MSLLQCVDRQRGALDDLTESEPLDRYRQAAISLLTDAKVREAFNVVDAEKNVLDRYGRHAFGWSLLMARRLIEAGVNLVQVNLGNNETWDTHGNMFPHLKEKLFPPTDQALSALLDDLHGSGLLDSTLIVMAGEFGRTPRISSLPKFYKLPGRDHWGKVQTVFLAGGGVVGGRIVGSSDKIGGFPRSDPRRPRTWPPRSIMLWDCRPRSHGTTFRIARITSIEEIRLLACFDSRSKYVATCPQTSYHKTKLGGSRRFAPIGIVDHSRGASAMTDRPQSKAPSEPSAFVYVRHAA